jgi:hypothetical protein
VEDTLEGFRSTLNQDRKALLWFRSNGDIAKLLLAWQHVDIKYTGKGGALPGEGKEQWTWLWRNYTFSYREWADLAGIADYRYATRLIARAIQLRLVLPDGTLPMWIDRYIEMSAIHEVRLITPVSTQQQQAPPAGLPEELEDEEEEE